MKAETTPEEGEVDLPALTRLSDVLDPEECAFIDAVVANSGGKLREKAWSEDGERPLWKHPEELKLISPVGSYAWIPTTRIVLCMEANNSTAGTEALALRPTPSEKMDEREFKKHNSELQRGYRYAQNEAPLLSADSADLEARLREAWKIIDVLYMDSLDNNGESWPRATEWQERNQRFSPKNAEVSHDAKRRCDH